MDEHILPKRYLAVLKTLYSNNNIVILPSDKAGGIVAMDSAVYYQKLLELLDDNNTYEQISPQTILKNVNNFNKL